MAIEWTDATRVREYVKQGTALTDAEIEDIIQSSEGYFKNVLCQNTTDFTFSAAKKAHWMLREAATLRAALIVIATTPLSLRTTQEAYMALQVYQQLYNEIVKELRDANVIHYLETTT